MGIGSIAGSWNRASPDCLALRVLPHIPIEMLDGTNGAVMFLCRHRSGA